MHHHQMGQTISNMLKSGTCAAAAVGVAEAAVVQIRPRLVDSFQKLQDTRTEFTSYLKDFIDLTNDHLEMKKIPLEDVSYVLCLEANIEDSLCIETRDELADLIKESAILKPKQKMAIKSQGEKIVWRSLQKDPLMPPCYFVHTHLTDDYIVVKVHQVVDTTEVNGEFNDPSTIHITAKVIAMKDIYEQVGELLWNHIHSLDKEQKSLFVQSKNNLLEDRIEQYKLFSQKMTEFVKEKV